MENETIETEDTPIWRRPASELTAVDQAKLGIAGALTGVAVVLAAHEIGAQWQRFSDWRWRRRAFRNTMHLEDYIETTCEEH